MSFRASESARGKKLAPARKRSRSYARPERSGQLPGSGRKEAEFGRKTGVRAQL